MQHADRTAIVTFGETAMNRRFVAWLDSVVNWLENQPSICSVIFTGTRNVFMTGADLTELRRLHRREDVEDFLRIPHRLMERIFGMEKWTASAINGHCVGGGLELALVCDFRLAADLPAPCLGLPEVRLGLVPALGATARVLSTLARADAIRILYSGDLVTAARAHAMGLVDELVPPGQVLTAALDHCAMLFENSPEAIRALKRLIVPDAERARFRDALRQSAVEFAACCSLDDKDARIDTFRRASRLRYGSSCLPGVGCPPIARSRHD